MNAKLTLLIAILFFALIANATNKSDNESTLKKSELDLKSKKLRPKKSTAILLFSMNETKLSAIYVKENVEITYQPIFEPKKIKLYKRK